MLKFLIFRVFGGGGGGGKGLKLCNVSLNRHTQAISSF